MEPLSIFVASSTEAEPMAQRIKASLEEALGEKAVIDLWRSKFDASETAIESLEGVAEEADFAVVVMRGDDITVSRNNEAVTPRDNLVFEMGLFMGALGRNRSFIARDLKEQLKLPTDIFDLTVLPFATSSPEELTTSLRDGCARLAQQIERRGLRPKWLAQSRAALALNGEFCRAVEGAWWERINNPEGSALSYFTIKPDPMTPGGLTLEGEAYDKDANLSARWKTEMVRIYPSERRIAYLWRGTHPLPDFANLKFHGYGTMEFSEPGPASSELKRGTGNFWDVDELEPGKTVCKPIDLGRIADEERRRQMETGTLQAKSDLVRAVMKEW